MYISNLMQPEAQTSLMACTVSGQIATGRQLCVALPNKAIVNIEGKQYIFALNKQPKNGEYSFSRHEVTTGVQQ